MLLLTPLLLVAQPSSPAATASIRGQVANAQTSATLEGARIRVVELEKTFVASERGDFEITGLPPGTYTVVVDYPGLDQHVQKVTVTSGQALQVDVSMKSDSFIVLDGFTVVTEREGNAAAVAGQRKAINSQINLSTDAFGNVAKGNLGNFLKRVPGVAGMTAGDGVDTDSVALRGNPAELVAIDIDGTRVANADAGSRAINVAAIDTQMIERVEVIKATTPEMDADSMGGRINLVTKSAFDTKGRRIVLRVADSYSVTYGNDLGYRRNNSLAPAFAISYSDVYSVLGGTRNLGIFLSGNWERVLDIRGTTAWNFTNPNAAGVDYSQFTNASIAMMEQVRGGATAKVDYKVSRQWTVGGSVRVSRFEDSMLRTRSAFATGTINTALTTDPLYTVVDGARYQPEQQDRRGKSNSVAWRFQSTWKPDSSMQLSTDVTYDRAIRKRTDDLVRLQSQRRINYINDRRAFPGERPDRRFADIRVMNFLYGTTTVATTAIPSTFLDVNPFSDDLSAATSSSLFFNRETSVNERASFRLDGRKRFSWRFPVEVRAGARYQTTVTKRDANELNGSLRGGGTGNNYTAFLATDWKFGGGIGRYPVGNEPDIAKVKALVNPQFTPANADPTLNWTFDPAYFTMNAGEVLANSMFSDRKIWEDTLATYIQSTVQVGRLQALGGVRLEHTEVERSVPIRNATFGSGFERYRLRRRDSTDYDRQMPSLHLKYDIARNFAAKGSVTTNISRPSFGALLDNGEWNANTFEGDVPNLYLKPKNSRTYDLSLEYYTGSVGSFTLSAFREEIKNYNTSVNRIISSVEAEALGAPIPASELALAPELRRTWEITTRDDKGHGWRQGLEIGYFQSYTFLPGAWRGLGAFANLTVLRTGGQFQTTNSANSEDTAPATVNSKLTNSPARTANAGLSYVYGRWDLRLQWNYISPFLESISLSDPDHRNKWRGERWQLDFNSKFRLTKRTLLSLDLINFTSNHGTKYRGATRASRQEETNALGFLATAGVQVTF